MRIPSGPVRCTCGIHHNIDHLRPTDDGRTLVCESCGAKHTVVVQYMVMVQAADGTLLDEPKSKKKR